MFGHGPYYFSTIRKMVSYFGNCFNDIHVTRTDADNNVIQVLKVPLTYAPKDKMLARVDSDPEIQRKTAITLPRISFEMVGLSYDGTRKLNSIGKNVKKDNDDANKFRRQYNPVPYNFDFNLYVYVKNTEDGTKIIEQIVPFFTPEWTATVNLIPEMNVAMDIPIVLQSINYDDMYDGAFDQRRVILWTLGFTVKGWFYGPVVSKPIVKISKTQFFFPTEGTITGNSDIVGRITVKPGLDANGNPTTSSNNSVAYGQIEVDDDFGYIVETEGIILNE